MPQPQPLLALAGLCAAALLVLLAVELGAAGIGRATGGRAPPGAAPSPAVPGADAAAASPFVPQAALADWTRTVLARPLFDPQRKPPSVTVSGPQRPRLAGIILAPNNRRAIFAGAGDARGTVAGVGQQAGAWRVLAIDRDGVRVSGPDGTRVLHLARGDHEGGGADAAGALPPHPSILDLLRARNALPNGGSGLMGGQMPVLPPALRALNQSPQQPPE